MARKKRTIEKKLKDAQFSPLPVVGIGASAGGLAALRRFFRHMPDRTGLAFVVVVHLSPEHESHLVDLLQPYSKFPVTQVTETVPLVPDHVFVIPPGRNLNTIDTHLRLSDLEEERRQRAPIDHFLHTLSDTHGPRAISVILTGTGSDGTLGLRQIKEKGGLTIVQSPEEAEYDGMPRSAITSGMVDLVLPLAEMPPHILRFAQTEPRVTMTGDEESLTAEERQTLQKIFAQVRARTGRDFAGYKRSTALRRIGRRMQLLNLEELSRYLDVLRQDAEEARRLSDDLLITVTNFFRDPEVFEHLEKEILPSLFQDKGPDDRIRIWSVGCATGEEVYSLAMLVLEEIGRSDSPAQIQIFASDLHQHSLRKAREGIYPESIEGDVSPTRLRRFFRKENGGYQVRTEVREIVVFAPHDLLKDPPFSHLDLIVCRNMLIYLQPEVQKQVMELFHYALEPGGYLLVGKSETVDASNLFRVVEKKVCLYQRKNVPTPEPRLPVFPIRYLSMVERHVAAPREEIPTRWGPLHARAVERYAPPSILLNPDYHMVHSSEHAGRFLRHPGGEPTTNVFKLVREELSMELRAALYTTNETRQSFRSKPIPVEIEGQPKQVIIRVTPAEESKEDLQGLFLVIFDEADVKTGMAGVEDGGGEVAGVRELKAELDVTRQRLQTLIEEHETGQEEMRAANEELHSANEELRSTLEELETSKEELQSMNEELTALNQENKHKVEELSQVTADLQNLLTSMDIATVFLDREMRILRFTPRLGELFSVWHGDRGRPLADLTHRLGDENLLSDALEVLKRLTPLEREVQSQRGDWYLTRILPYRSDDRIDGVVITFVDISRRKQAEDALRESQTLLAQELEAVRRLHSMTMRVVTASGLHEALEEILRAAIELQNSEMGTIQLFSRDRRLELVASEGFSREYLDSLQIQSAEDDTVATRAIRTRERSAKADVETDREFENYRVLAASAGFRALQSTPLISHNGEILGVLSTYYRQPHELSEREARLLDLLAQHAANLIDRIRAQEALRELNETLEKRVQEKTEQVQAMVARLTMAEQAERRRVSEILHDNLQQLLYSIQMKLTFVLKHAEEGDPKQLLQETREAYNWTREAIDSTRRLTVDLSPPVLHHEDFPEALEWLLTQMREAYGLNVELEVRHDAAVQNENMRVLLFQIVRELLFNVVKHGETDRARLELERKDGLLVIRVEDEGKGFDKESLQGETETGFGLYAIQDRLGLLGGRMEIVSNKGQGTRVAVYVPQSA